jgi:sugar phosphate isomerase/epimerase
VEDANAMKIGCSSWSFREAFGRRELDLLSFVPLAAELGLEGIEPLAGSFPSVSPRFLLELRSALVAHAIEISAVALSNNFAFPDEAERRQQCEDVIGWMRVCRELEVSVMRVFTGNVSEGVDTAQAEGWVRGCFEAVLPAAERLGVVLAIENHDAVMPDADSLAGLVMEFGSSALQLNPDPGGFLPGYMDKPAAECEMIYQEFETAVRLAANAHLHVFDPDADGCPTPLDVPRLLAILRKACYDRYLTLEYCGETDARAAVADAVRYLRPMVEGV